MADMDYTASTVSLTTAGNVIDDDFGLGFPPWNISGISQVLLPVLCAIFIAIVIIVIACCLIQKKSKSPGVLRQKSSHTIETLHEVSDLDIYDVIDEFRVKNASPDKIPSRHGKIDYNCLLPSHRHCPHSKLSNVFASKSTTIAGQCTSKLDILTSKALASSSRDWVSRTRESSSDNARLSTNTEGGASSVSNDDDGIYETLDRHWTLKNEQKTIHPVANCLSNTSVSGHTHSHTDTDLNNINAISETSSSPSSHSSEELQPPEELPAPHGEARKLVCQISMFEFSNEESKPALIETTYYQIQPQISQISGSSANIPELFQKTNLRIVQDDTKETNPIGNLLLKPLKEDEVLLHQLSQSLVRKNSQLMKTTKIYEKLHKSGSKRVPTLLVKKSESFRTASSELHAAKERHRISRRKSDSSDIEAPPINARSPTRQALISAGPEATRILTKLGPLPPVPGHCQAFNQRTESTHAVDKVEDCTSQNNANKVPFSFTPLSKKQNLSLNIDSEQAGQLASDEHADNLLSHQTVRVPSSNCDQVPTDLTEFNPQPLHGGGEMAVAGRTEDGDFNVNREPSGMESSSQDSVSTESVCRVKIERVCDSTSSSPDEEESNYYFVLEARAGTSGSCRNSDVGSSSDCYDMGSSPNIEISRLGGDRNRCSIEMPT